MDFIPYGYCHCGCGQKTDIVKADRPKRGYKKGEPLTYRIGHFQRLKAELTKTDRFLAKEDIPVIKQEVASGVSQRSLAEKYGVSTYGIWAVIHGRSWKHIT